jgi:ElaB/YqjD/DUF883 family membrane-anchored ribosome-binding protein
MDRDNMVPGTQARAGAGTTGQGLGLGATTPGTQGARTGMGDDESIRERGAEMAERGLEKIENAAEQGRERAEHALDSGKARLADGISRIGERLDEQATRLEERGGLGSRAGRYVQHASDAAEDSAEYLRNHDLDVIRDDFADQVRAHPLLSCGIALGAGFMLGSAGSSSSSSRDSGRNRSSRFRDDHDYDDDHRSYRNDRDDEESGVRAQLGRAVVAGITTLLTREIQSRVSGRTR